MLSFWPFKETKPKESDAKKILADIADILIELPKGKPLLYDGDEKESDLSPCPSEHRMYKVCACMDCPKRDTCAIEADHREGDCKSRFVRMCSVKSCGKPTGYEKVIVDIIVHDAVKKIVESESNWVYKKAKEKDNEGKEDKGFEGFEGAGI